MLLLSAMIDDPYEKSKFDQLYDTYKSSMYYTAYGIVKNVSDAEDVVQLSLLKVISILSDIPMDSIESRNTRNLLFTITKNTAIDFYRKNIKAPIDMDLSHTNAKSLSAEELYIEAEDYRALIEIIDHMDEKYKEILRLRYLNQLSNQQIADILNIRDENVRVRLNRARKMLAERLKERKNNE